MQIRYVVPQRRYYSEKTIPISMRFPRKLFERFEDIARDLMYTRTELFILVMDQFIQKASPKALAPSERDEESTAPITMRVPEVLAKAITGTADRAGITRTDLATCALERAVSQLSERN